MKTEAELIDIMRDVARERDRMAEAIGRVLRYANKFPNMPVSDDVIVDDLSNAIRQR